GLPHIDAPLGVNCDERVLIKESRVIVGCCEVTTSRRIDEPRARAGEDLPLNRCKSYFDASLARSTSGGDVFGKKPPQLFRSAVREYSEADPVPRTTNTGHLMLPNILQRLHRQFVRGQGRAFSRSESGPDPSLRPRATSIQHRNFTAGVNDPSFTKLLAPYAKLATRAVRVGLSN